MPYIFPVETSPMLGRFDEAALDVRTR